MDKEIFQTKKVYYTLIILLFIVGFFIRSLVYSFNYDIYEDDECRLLIAYLEQSWWGCFLPLKYAQSAPPLFIIFQRLIGAIFDYKEWVLKLIPLLASFASIFVFYKISKKFFKYKLSIILSLLLFAINARIAYFSSIIKQYSTDILIGLLCIYFLHNLKIRDLSRKQILILTVILIILPFISLPSIFFIASFFLLNWFENIKDKTFYKKAICIALPFIGTMLAYYIFNLHPSQVSLTSAYGHSWEIGYAAGGKVFFLSTIGTNLAWFFIPCKFVLFQLALLMFGLYYAYREKSSLHKYLLISFSLTIFASLLDLYPFYNRVSLYILVPMILFLVKPLDVVIKSKQFITFFIIFLIAFNGYNQNYIKEWRGESMQIPSSPEYITQILVEKYDPKTDVVFLNEASASSLVFYGSLKGFENKDTRVLPSYDETSKDIFKDIDPNKFYWLYLIKDYPKSPQYEILLKALDSYKIYSYYSDRYSHLIKFGVRK